MSIITPAVFPLIPETDKPATRESAALFILMTVPPVTPCHSSSTGCPPSPFWAPVNESDAPASVEIQRLAER